MMINRVTRTLIWFSILGLILHLGNSILTWQSQGVYTVKTKFESLALGVCIALLGLLIGSIIRMRIQTILELTRIEEEIGQTSEISRRSAQPQQYEQVNPQSQQPTFKKRAFVSVEVLPTLEVHEETIR